ncbi:MAG TPA: hypothetical protein VFK05_35065 [Polyangiaceae bacterium]|nr:hypothetical protein [Polyangiaceae bacterium]
MVAPEGGRNAILNKPTAQQMVRAVAGCAALAMLSGLYWIFDRDQPLLDSPLSQYALALGLVALFVSSSGVIGLSIVKRLLPGRLRLDERLALAFSFGVLAFHGLVWLFGMLGRLNRAACLLLPGLLLFAGAREAWALRGRLSRLAKVFAGKGRPAARPVAVYWLGGFTLFVLAGHALTTASIGYDAAWYHLPIAEIYSARHAIRPLADGWYLGTFPQLASVLYAWALTAAHEPALSFTSAAMVEVALVALAVFSIVPCVRALTPGRGRANWAWATIALFPAVYLYPPRIEADYAAAAFAPALLLTTIRAYRRFEARELSAWAIALGGVALTKYSAVSLLAFPTLVMTLRALERLLGPASERRAVLRALGAAAGAFLLVTAPHWFKNLIYYGDPLFPQLSGPGAFTSLTRQFYLGFMKELWRPSPGWPGVVQTLRAMFTFSFEPHEYSNYNPGHAIFGSLFSMTLAPLLFLRRARRALAWHVAVLMGVCVWFRIHHQDRYLLALVPWMCAVTGATIRELCAQGVLPRLITLAACALQFVWGVRWAMRLAPFDAIREAISAPTIEEWRNIQTRRWPTMVRVGRALPPNATLMVHDERIRTGLRHNSLSDAQGYQTRISFVEIGSNARVFDRLKELGVTHLFAQGHSTGEDTIGSDLVYFSFFKRYGLPMSEVELRRMPEARPSDERSSQRLALVQPCGAFDAAAGLYRVVELNDAQTQTPSKLKAEPVTKLAGQGEDLARARAQAEFLVVGDHCPHGTVTSEFQHLVTRGNLIMYFRPEPPT